MKKTRVASPCVTAYALAQRSGANPSLNLLWALEGALTGQRWQDVAREHRTSLLLALDEVLARRHAKPADSTVPPLRRHARARAGQGRRDFR